MLLHVTICYWYVLIYVCSSLPESNNYTACITIDTKKSFEEKEKEDKVSFSYTNYQLTKCIFLYFNIFLSFSSVALNFYIMFLIIRSVQILILNIFSFISLPKKQITVFINYFQSSIFIIFTYTWLTRTFFCYLYFYMMWDL